MGKKEEKVGTDGVPYTVPTPEFNGPVGKRSCTDIFCLFFFLAFIGGMMYVAVYAYQNNGDPLRFVYGVDSWGNTCNKKNKGIAGVNYSGENTKGLKRLFYFDASASILSAIADVGQESARICVKSCPNNGTLDSGEDLLAFYQITDTKLCRYDIHPNDYPSHYGTDGECPGEVTPQTSFLNRCVPESLMNPAEGLLSAGTDAISGVAESALSALSLNAQCAENGDFLSNVANDVIRTWKEILYLGAMSFAVSIIMVFLMRFFAAVVIWVLVIGAAVGSLAGAAYCWYQYYTYTTAVDDIKSISLPVDSGPTTVSPEILTDAEATLKEKQKEWFIIACIVSGAALIIVLILLVMRKRIALVVQLFTEAGRAMAKMPLLLLQPLWTLLGLIIFFALFALGLLYVETGGDPKVDGNTGFVSFEKDDILKYGRWYYIFGILWLIQFCVACQQLVIAGAVALWFFTRDKSSLRLPIITSLKRLLRYHLGSVAFGSFIIALVQFARLVLAYVQRKLKGRAGKIVGFVLKCLQCCLWCFEKVLKFLNRNAYVMIAIHGSSFCKAARQAFAVIVNNALRVAAINSVGTFCLFLGKIGVAAIVVTIGYEFFFKVNEELCYFFVPLILAGIISLFVAHCFFCVYSMAIDTIFMCFCEDCERNDGITKPYFMSTGLMKFVDNAKAVEREAAKKAAGAAASKPKPHTVDW